MFEVIFAGHTHYKQAGSYLHAAIQVFQEADLRSASDFTVTNLETEHEENIPLSEVIDILQLAGDYDPDLPEPPLSPDCDIVLFANDPLV